MNDSFWAGFEKQAEEKFAAAGSKGNVQKFLKSLWNSKGSQLNNNMGSMHPVTIGGHLSDAVHGETHYVTPRGRHTKFLEAPVVKMTPKERALMAAKGMAKATPYVGAAGLATVGAHKALKKKKED